MKRLIFLFLLLNCFSQNLYGLPLRHIKSLQESLTTEAKFFLARNWAYLNSLKNGSYQFALYGQEPVSAEIQMAVDQVCAKFGVDPKTITCNYAWPLLKSRAFSTKNALYLDKEWFATLTPWQQKFILGHEIAHIAQAHHVKGIIVDTAAFLGFASLFLTKKIKFTVSRAAGAILGHQLLSLGYSRWLEKEADILSAKKLGLTLNPEVLRALKENENPTWLKWLVSWFATHPSELEQAEYLLAAQTP